ncbi:SDR family NAD(P)-dependent oxidoreductase [Ideonella livida]|uniref:SDR family oxidoreductase n=1 Tax=Ideonella livida TaxID=2707176 RepID=A0A7C9THE9_9BURK|nr:SDR family NAD(P)-dependent oxidoreductase [Ideonella livida]NDY90358.1 SDR family oxidoreductase [Ideonella livida]
MDLQLHGRRALVTGSTAGIGFAIAARLAAEGAAVTLNGRDTSRVTAAAARLQTRVPGAEITAVAADLGTAEGCAQLAGAAQACDLLIHNLGIYAPGEFAQTDDATWQRFFEVNVMSGVRLSRVALPAMLARNWGRIVFISSESGIQPPPEMVHYGMTKAAQLSLSRGLAEQTTGTGVTVNAVLPGPTRTEGSAAFMAERAAELGLSADEVVRQYFAQERPSSLIRRFVEPDEVAATVAFLCSPLAGATHGAAVRVDGGVVRSMV